MTRTVVRGCAIIAILAATLTACGSAPSLPADSSPPAMEALLTGTGGPTFLHDISTYGWSDGGAEAGQRFGWIGTDAASADSAAATQAGQSADVLAQFLADNYDDLMKLHHGFLGLSKETLGDRNPQLLRAYANALAPFSQAMFDPDAAVKGFMALDRKPSYLSRTTNVFALMDTDVAAGRLLCRRAGHRRRPGPSVCDRRAHRPHAGQERHRRSHRRGHALRADRAWCL
jgi:hypothetical protein